MTVNKERLVKAINQYETLIALLNYIGVGVSMEILAIKERLDRFVNL